MFANPKWFQPRRYGGWGLSPASWQGWAYIAFVAAPIIILGQLQLPGNWSTILMFVWGVIFAIDFIDIFIHLQKDERDVAHEALAERNALWFMVTALGLGIAYQASRSAASQTLQVDPVILIALLGAVVVKAATHFYLRNK